MGAIKNLFGRVKGTGAVVLLVIGLALALVGTVLPGLFHERSEETVTENEEEDLAEMKKELEREIEAMIERMDGIEEASVLLTLDEGSSTVYAQDGTYSSGSLQSRKYVLSDGSAPIPVKLVCPKVRGVAVVCTGGSNPVLCQKVTEMLCALLDLNSNHVFVSG